MRHRRLHLHRRSTFGGFTCVLLLILRLSFVLRCLDVLFPRSFETFTFAFFRGYFRVRSCIRLTFPNTGQLSS